MGTPGTQQSRGTRRSKQATTPPTGTRKSNLALSSGRRGGEGAPSISIAREQSFAPTVTDVLEAHDPKRKHDYKQSTEAYKNYWTSCTDAYIFEINEKKSLSIDQLIPAPPEMNIRSHEQRLTADVLHYLVHMPDKSTKQTLCVMPVDQT